MHKSHNDRRRTMVLSRDGLWHFDVAHTDALTATKNERIECSYPLKQTLEKRGNEWHEFRGTERTKTEGYQTSSLSFKEMVASSFCADQKDHSEEIKNRSLCGVMYLPTSTRVKNFMVSGLDFALKDWGDQTEDTTYVLSETGNTLIHNVMELNSIRKWNGTWRN